MATLSISVDTLLQKVVDIVNDSDYGTDEVLAHFNNLLLELAGGMLIAERDGTTRVTPPLPDLFYIGTITADKDLAYITMPANYQRGLIAVYNASGTPIKIYDRWDAFIAVNPLLNTAGAVKYCIVRGRTFYYQGIPTADEPLKGHYFRIPNEITEGATSIDGIPSFLADPIFVNGACYRIYDQIEDGTEGNKTNTNFYLSKFNQALINLEKWVPVEGESFFIK